VVFKSLNILKKNIYNKNYLILLYIMSFNRTRYDNCATEAYTNRSVNEGNYRLFPGYGENSQECLSYNGPRNSKNDVSTPGKDLLLDWGKMAQVESQLMSRTITLSRCNENQADMDYTKNPVVNKLECSAGLNTEDSRFTNPIQSYRSLSTTELQLQPFLFSNPQCHVIDDRIGLGSRNKVKDTYKVPAAHILDMGQALPKEDPNSPHFGYDPCNSNSCAVPK
jgi:hypothetical protein